MGLIIGGVIYLVASPRDSSTIEYIIPTQKTTLVISVTGKVNHPGVYSLSPGSRINDAVLAAGGTLADADLSNVNLAEVLKDGEQITIPGTKSETPSASSQTQGKIDINTASLEELDSLPGIGAQKAQAIITYRQEHGVFRSIDDLLYVPGFGTALVDSIRDLIEIN